MDRRIQKSKQAIMDAFIKLMSEIDQLFGMVAYKFYALSGVRYGRTNLVVIGEVKYKLMTVRHNRLKLFHRKK